MPGWQVEERGALTMYLYNHTYTHSHTYTQAVTRLSIAWVWWLPMPTDSLCSSPQFNSQENQPTHIQAPVLACEYAYNHTLLGPAS